MDRWKSRGGKSQRREEDEREDRRRERARSKKMQACEKQKSRETAHFQIWPMICGSGGSKIRLAKAAGAEPSGIAIWDSIKTPGIAFWLSLRCNTANALPAQKTIGGKNDNELS